MLPFSSITLASAQIDDESSQWYNHSPMSSASPQPAQEFPSKPYLTSTGTLVIPNDCDPKYQYWKSGQTVLKTLEEIGAPLEVMRVYKREERA